MTLPNDMLRRSISEPAHYLPEEARREQLAIDWKELFQGQKGARVLSDIMRRSGLFDVLPAGVPDREVFIAEGRRDLALTILEAAGYGLDRMGEALVQDDLRLASDQPLNQPEGEFEDGQAGD